MTKAVTVVNVHEAKTTLSKLLARVSLGEEIVIARGGKPVARLVPERDRREPRRPGGAEGLITIHPGFWEPLTDLEEFF